MSGWYMEPAAALEIEKARRARPAPSSSEERAWRRAIEAAESGSASGNRPRGVRRVDGGVAEIAIDGILTKKPFFWAWLLAVGNTSYLSIGESLAWAERSPDVGGVRLLVDSVGGSVDGLFDVLGALDRMQKPVTVVAENAFSAAYGIAAAAGPITAVNVGSMFGSVGVATRMYVDDEVVDVTNTESPDKRPDPATEEGRAVIRRELDAVFDLFIDAIARGRGVSTARVREDFGRGASFVARDAQRRGMIDAVGIQHRPTNTTTRGTMNMSTEFESESYARGRDDERARVLQHIQLGKESNDLPLALECIASGVSVVQATGQYLASARNATDRRARQEESDEAAAKTKSAAAKPETTDLESKVMDLVERQLGRANVGAAR